MAATLKQEPPEDALQAADDKAEKARAYARYIRSIDDNHGALSRTQKVPPEIGLKIKEGGARSVKVWFDQYTNGGCDWAKVIVNIKAWYMSWLETHKKKVWKTEKQLDQFVW